MSKLNVLIVGASIAGPTAAYWFAKAGAKVTIIERFPKLRTNGQNVDIRISAVSVMRKMSMVETVRSKVSPLKGISFVRDNSQPYGTITPTGNPDQQSLVSEYEIFRGDLAQILFDMTKDNENIDYVFGEQVASMQQHESDKGPITVEFLNGFPTSKFDLVVACDGANSRTRAIGFGCGVRDHIKPANQWAAYFTIQEDLLKGSKIGHAFNAPGGRFIGIGPTSSTGNHVTAMGIHPQDNGEIMEAFREAVKQGDDAVKHFVASRYEGAGWKCAEAMKGMMEATDFYASEFVQVKAPCLYKGRFVLVGDAGYAGSAGTGTTLAMTGAYVLAGEILRSKGDLEAGLVGYEKRMRPLIDEFQKVPPLVQTLLGPQTAWGIWLRNMIFAFICWSRILEFGQRFFSASFANTNKYAIEDYEW